MEMEHNSSAEEEIRCGSLVVNLVTKDVNISGQEVMFSPLQFKVLVYLARNQNRPVSPEELLKHCWENHCGSLSQIRNVIKRIRKKMSIRGNRYHDYIHTKRGWGYQLSPPRVINTDNKQTTNRQ